MTDLTPEQRQMLRVQNIAPSYNPSPVADCCGAATAEVVHLSVCSRHGPALLEALGEALQAVLDGRESVSGTGGPDGAANAGDGDIRGGQ